MPIHAHDIGLRRKAVSYPGNILHIDGSAANVFDGNSVEVCNRLRRRVRNGNIVFLGADLGRPGGKNQVLQADGVDDIQGREAF